MINIGDVLVDESIIKTDFACDLESCKGGCCTFPGEYGAPISENEIELMKENYDVALEYLAQYSIDYIEKHGFIEGSPGDYSTVCINKKDCVFVFYENDIAFCAYERAFLEGKSKFRKPISCHLFPIREGSFGGKALYYERITECKPALAKGRVEQIKMYENLKEALIRKMGLDWYNLLIENSRK